MSLQIEAAGITHRGTVRENNEDCIAIGYWTSQETMESARVFEHPLDTPFACAVADGMGGHNDGEKASLLVARSLARRLPEFGPDKIRVNCVNPVFSPETALSADFAGGTISDEAKARFLATIPLGRFSTPLDVANACLYLASDEASLISGVCIEVDGARCV